MIKLIWVGITFAGILGTGLLGMGIYMLLPQAIRNRIENMGNDN